MDAPQIETDFETGRTWVECVRPTLKKARHTGKSEQLYMVQNRKGVGMRRVTEWVLNNGPHQIGDAAGIDKINILYNNFNHYGKTEDECVWKTYKSPNKYEYPDIADLRVSSDGTVILRREKQKIAGFECGYVIIDEDDIYSGFFGKQKKKDQWAKYKTAANIP